jgi:hypothetical protein
MVSASDKSTGTMHLQLENIGIDHTHENSLNRPASAFPCVQTVSHLNWLTALPSYEDRGAVNGVK